MELAESTKALIAATEEGQARFPEVQVYANGLCRMGDAYIDVARR